MIFSIPATAGSVIFNWQVDLAGGGGADIFQKKLRPYNTPRSCRIAPCFESLSVTQEGDEAQEEMCSM